MSRCRWLRRSINFLRLTRSDTGRRHRVLRGREDPVERARRTDATRLHTTSPSFPRRHIVGEILEGSKRPIAAASVRRARVSVASNLSIPRPRTQTGEFSHLRMVPLPPVRTDPASFLSLSTSMLTTCYVRRRVGLGQRPFGAISSVATAPMARSPATGVRPSNTVTGLRFDDLFRVLATRRT